MKIRVQQLNPTIGDIEGNAAAIIQAITQAETDDMDILLLPELAVCGYSPMDLLQRPAFLESIYRANKKIARHAQKAAVIFGTVTPNESQTGRSIFNTAIFAHQGEIKSKIHKTLLPSYQGYDEVRYFEPNSKFECIEFGGRKIGITICEDIWGNYGHNPAITYSVNPVQKLANSGAEAIFNLSASPFDKTKHKARVEMLRHNIEQTELPIFYANQVGGNTNFVSDGDSMVINDDKTVVARAPLFQEASIDAKWNGKNVTSSADGLARTLSKQKRIFDALCYGLKEYLRKSGLGQKVIIGLSGGIDSALVTCIAAEAVGRNNVTAVTLPSSFSSTESSTDSQVLADNLGLKLEKIEIKSIYEQSLKTLKPLFDGTSFGIAEENLQARIRGMLLMALSNKFGGLVLNAGNKSEEAVGYSTLYGDSVGGLSVIGDLFKTEVYALARWLNEKYYGKEVIPQSIINKAPSAELRPDQKDSDSLPNYDTLDSILKRYIEQRKSILQIIKEGFEEEAVQKTVQLFNQSEHKRHQAPPALKISYTSLGAGLRRPIVGKYI